MYQIARISLVYRSCIARVSLVYRPYISADGIRAFNTLRISNLVVCSISTRLFFIIEYKSNIGVVSGHYRVEVTKFEKLVVAVIVSAVFFAIAIILVFAVVLFVLVIAANVITAVIAAAAVVLLVTVVAVAAISIFVATAALRVEFVRRSSFLLFVTY